MLLLPSKMCSKIVFIMLCLTTVLSLATQTSSNEEHNQKDGNGIPNTNQPIEYEVQQANIMDTGKKNRFSLYPLHAANNLNQIQFIDEPHQMKLKASKKFELNEIDDSQITLQSGNMQDNEDHKANEQKQNEENGEAQENPLNQETIPQEEKQKTEEEEKQSKKSDQSQDKKKKNIRIQALENILKQTNNQNQTNNEQNMDLISLLLGSLAVSGLLFIAFRYRLVKMNSEHTLLPDEEQF